MKRKLIIISSLLAIFLAFAIVSIFGGLIYFAHSFRTENESARNQGKEFGASTDQQGCVSESLRQFAEFKENNFLVRLQQLHISKFTEGCLTASRPTKDFCENVPKPGRFLSSEEWGIKKCKAAGLNYEGPCTAIFVEVVKTCALTKQETVSYPE